MENKLINPFEGISELQKNRLFKLLESHIYTFNKNEEIVPTLKTENIVGIVLSGEACIYDVNYNGNYDLVENLPQHSVFGAYISNINNANYQITALVPNTSVLIIDYNKLIDNKNIAYTYYSIFLTNVFNIVNLKINEKNDRINILTKKSIREKLLSYFATEYKKTHSKFIYLPSNFKDLADYLAINRSAMFRELKNLKDERFITIDKKRITLLYTPNIL